MSWREIILARNAALSLREPGDPSPLALKAVLLMLATHANRTTGEALASAPTVARELHTDEKTVRQSLRTLARMGLIEATPRPGRATVYLFVTPGESPGVDADRPRASHPDTPGESPRDPGRITRRKGKEREIERGRALATSARRPHCAVCDVLFDPSADLPPDRICARCHEDGAPRPPPVVDAPHSDRLDKGDRP